MRISVVGSGYVGLITAAGMAEKGHQVVCVDVDKSKIDMINAGEPPIYERGLKEILDHVVPSGLKASVDLESAVLSSEVTFICVGTPSDDDGSINLKYVKEVSGQIGRILGRAKSYTVIVVKSTIIPGSTEEHVIPILERESGKKAGADFGVVMNPEFLREGAAIEDFMEPDRIVIGSHDARSGDVIESLYYKFKAPVLRVNLRTAEMIKYTANAMLATKISFINEVGNICKSLDVDVYDVAKGIGMDHRIGPHFISAGPGFGGSCFPKDVKALVHKALEVGVETRLLGSVLAVNEAQPSVMLKLLKTKFRLKGAKVAVLGLAFKAGTDDMRESPATPVVEGLLKEGADITAYDPEALENARSVFGDRIRYAKSVKEAVAGAQLAVVVTEWPEFKTLDLSGMARKRLFDARHIVNRDLLPGDVEYEGLCW